MKALITGASSGIGRDMAKVLYKKGYELILVARDEKKLNELKQELYNQAELSGCQQQSEGKWKIQESKRRTQKIRVIAMDLTIAENCKELYNMEPNINLLINNAGFGVCGEFIKTNLDKEISLIHTNVQAVHILTKLYLQNMQQRNNGKILNVASIAGFMPGPLMATYYASKAYVVRLSEAIREELKKSKSKVKISILCPGPVATNFNKVANVEFAVKSLSSEYVAQYAIQKLEKGKFYIVPGISIKMARIGSKITPTTIISKISYRMQKRKLQ